MAGGWLCVGLWVQIDDLLLCAERLSCIGSTCNNHPSCIRKPASPSRNQDLDSQTSSNFLWDSLSFDLIMNCICTWNSLLVSSQCKKHCWRRTAGFLPLMCFQKVADFIFPHGSRFSQQMCLTKISWIIDFPCFNLPQKWRINKCTQHSCVVHMPPLLRELQASASGKADKAYVLPVQSPSSTVHSQQAHFPKPDLGGRPVQLKHEVSITPTWWDLPVAGLREVTCVALFVWCMSRAGWHILFSPAPRISEPQPPASLITWLRCISVLSVSVWLACGCMMTVSHF